MVDNNLARAEIEADLTVVGTPYETGLLGELTLLEGSEVRLNERRYEVERGSLRSQTNGASSRRSTCC